MKKNRKVCDSTTLHLPKIFRKDKTEKFNDNPTPFIFRFFSKKNWTTASTFFVISPDASTKRPETEIFVKPLSKFQALQAAPT